MARIQLLNQHYAPETASTGQHLTDLAEHLVAAGHEVRVVCSRNEVDGELPPRREVLNGVEIVRLSGTRCVHRSALGRLLDYASFHVLAGLRTVLNSWPDVVVTLTTPPMLGVWGSLAQRFGRAKHICFLMDHHPDAEFESGMLRRTSLLGRALEAIYAWTLRTAWHNVVLGPYQGQRVLARQVDPARVSIIPIWSSGDEITHANEGAAAVRRELGWADRFVVLYSGNAGNVHCFDELLEAAASIDGSTDETEPAVHFAFVGGGPRRSQIEEFVRERSLSNVSFHRRLPRELLGGLLAAADVHVTTLRPEHVGVSVPGKLYGQLASGRPVFFVGPEHCESAEDVIASGGGLTFRPGEARSLAESILALRDDPERCSEMGRSGRAWFMRQRERRVSCAAWQQLIEGVLEANRPGTETQAQLV
jgi:glycosyltransferase involved in cell wall biosynthesis